MWGAPVLKVQKAEEETFTMWKESQERVVSQGDQPHQTWQPAATGILERALWGRNSDLQGRGAVWLCWCPCVWRRGSWAQDPDLRWARWLVLVSEAHGEAGSVNVRKCTLCSAAAVGRTCHLPGEEAVLGAAGTGNLQKQVPSHPVVSSSGSCWWSLTASCWPS